ncbi:MAG: CDC48 family AAA ATPase [Bacillota bacterium]|nr:CDC48 family AAA ATPase [Bacillota bacterium]
MILRVSEALPKDVGRGIARLDPEAMATIGCTVGDIIEITGKRSSVAKAMPAYPEHRGRQAVQIDGVVRQNAGAGLDEKVEVSLVEARQAISVVVSPVGGAAFRHEDSRYVARLLEGLPMVVGDRLRATLIGSRTQEFQVLETVPLGPVILSGETRVVVRSRSAGEDGRPAGVSYEDVGGLPKEVRRLREMIEMPLRFPEVFERLGIEAPRGVLLSGPPGCGKTLIARAVAGETSATFLTINGPEIIHKFYGESEAHLRQIFDQAHRGAPSILFIDEIDAIAPKRSEVTGEVEKRVVAQLLGLMDGLKDRGQVIVIGATNIPNSLDPALRRPGRFDREISIGIPDRKGRLEILQIHTRGMPLAADVDLGWLAEVTHGFVGADLAALCREGAMSAIRRIVPAIDLSASSLPYEKLATLEVAMGDFSDALRSLEPSALREVFSEIPDVRWDDVGGLTEVKRMLREAVEWPLKYQDLIVRAGYRSPRGILLYGPPGTGKTLMAKAIATESGYNFISVKGPELLSKYVGESEKAVREVFQKARQASPCILFLDEVESLVPARGTTTDSGVSQRVVSQFLTELDGIQVLGGVLVLAATNRMDLVDPALLRAGRFDIKVEMPLPDEDARLEILAVHLKGRPLESEINVGELARRMAGMSGADIESLCRSAAMAAIRETIAGHGRPEDLVISRRHFVSALAEVESLGGGTGIGKRDVPLRDSEGGQAYRPGSDRCR